MHWNIGTWHAGHVFVWLALMPCNFRYQYLGKRQGSPRFTHSSTWCTLHVVPQVLITFLLFSVSTLWLLASATRNGTRWVFLCFKAWNMQEMVDSILQCVTTSPFSPSCTGSRTAVPKSPEWPAQAAWSRSPKFPPFLAQLGILHVPAKQECRCRATVQVKRLHAYASLQRHSVLMNVWSLLGCCTSNCAGQQSPIPVQFPLSNSSFAGLPWKHGKKSSHPTTPSFSQAWMGWACAWWTWATQRPWTSFQWLLLAGRARIFHCFKIIQTTSSSNCCVTCNYCRS